MATLKINDGRIIALANQAIQKNVHGSVWIVQHNKIAKPKTDGPYENPPMLTSFLEYQLKGIRLEANVPLEGGAPFPEDSSGRPFDSGCSSQWGMHLRVRRRTSDPIIRFCRLDLDTVVLEREDRSYRLEWPAHLLRECALGYYI